VLVQVFKLLSIEGENDMFRRRSLLRYCGTCRWPFDFITKKSIDRLIKFSESGSHLCHGCDFPILVVYDGLSEKHNVCDQGLYWMTVSPPPNGAHARSMTTPST
jgi:hypothetical protein